MSREEVDSLTALPGPPGDDELGADTWAWLLAWASLVSGRAPVFALDQRGLLIATHAASALAGEWLDEVAARLSVALAQTLPLHPEPGDDALALRLGGRWLTALRVPVLTGEQWVAVVVVSDEVPATAVRRHLRQGLLEALAGIDDA